MFTYRKLAIVFTVAAMCAGTSAFAEQRHRDATSDSWRGQRSQQTQRQSYRSDARVQQSQFQDRGESRAYNRSQQYQYQAPARTQSQFQDRGESRAYNRSQQYQYQAPARTQSQFQDRSQQYQAPSRVQSYQYRATAPERVIGSVRGSFGGHTGAFVYNGREAYEGHGRISRYEPWNGGYRVWLGAGYPFYVSSAFFNLHHLGIGVNIGLGGYWNPLGYYDAYSYPYAYSPYSNYPSTAGELHGVVESVDYRNGTVVLRDDVSGNFVTTVMRGNDPRFGQLRPGDYVDFNGSWSRGGVFNAYNVAQLGDGGRRYDGPGPDAPPPPPPDGY